MAKSLETIAEGNAGRACVPSDIYFLNFVAYRVRVEIQKEGSKVPEHYDYYAACSDWDVMNGAVSSNQITAPDLDELADRILEKAQKGFGPYWQTRGHKHIKLGRCALKYDLYQIGPGERMHHVPHMLTGRELRQLASKTRRQLKKRMREA